MSLTQYRAKRNFGRTVEPAGGKPVRRGSPAPLFVIQKHAASRLHYDFRLALEGVLKSWAVPKGVPTEKGDKRLAMQVEDHPLDYAGFEGTIPPGNYGAGTVMVWDTGTYETLEDNPAKALANGKLVVSLAGRKLKGQWTLVRMRHAPGRAENAWLLIKTGADARRVSAKADDTSALSGRSMKQIAFAGDKTWQSNRVKSVSGAKHSSPMRHHERTTNLSPRLKKLPAADPGFVEPMKARLEVDLPANNGWIFEVKLDGIRAIAVKDGSQVRLFSRLPRELTNGYPQIIEALRELPEKKFVVDGEIVALDDQGRSSFQLLQNLKRSSQNRPPVFFYLFDLLNLNGRDLKKLPLIERKAALENLLQNAPEPLRFSASFGATPAKVWEQIKKLGLEGVIAKKRDSSYEPGRRSGAWLKIKAQNEQEFVIGGYTTPQGSRQHFGSVLVGYYDGPKLVFASKVGTGFNTASLRSLYQLFQKHKTDTCPFANLPTTRQGRSGQGLTASEMKRCTWLKPVLVCQVKFLEWTRDGNLRQPVFLGLREDKKANEVVRETAAR